MRVVIVTQYYPPDPPSWIPAGLAQGLADRGHDVRVLTTFPHYETGRIATGYRQSVRQIRQIDDIDVCRVPIFPSHSSNPVGRAVNYLSFAVSSRWAHRFVADADVIYAYATPMTVASAAMAWSRALGIPFVLHVQDLWPESVTSSGLLPGPLSRLAGVLISRWLGRVYNSAAVTLAIAPTMAKMLQARGAPRERTRVVFNWSNDADQLTPEPRSAGSASGTNLLYAGNLGRMQDVGSIIEAIALVQDLPGLRLRIAGFGVEEPRLRGMVAQLGLSNVEFLGRLSGSNLDLEYACADYQFVTLRDLPIFRGTLPSKFQAGLARGVPVITTVRGDLADLVAAHDLGLTAAPENPVSLADAIRTAHASSQDVRRRRARHARQFYDDQMSRSAGIDAIEDALAWATNRAGASI